MSFPICPACESRYVEPDQFSAGRNQCRACGHLGPVASFHTIRDVSYYSGFSRSADYDTITKQIETELDLYGSNVSNASRRTARNILDTPVPKHKPVKHWSD
jgi:hypothetical protein